MSNLYDPYRNAVRNNLEDKASEKRKKDFIEKRSKENSKNFLQKKIYLSDLTNLPESLANSLFFGLFIFIPYSLGVIFTFLVLAKASLKTYEGVNNSFAFSWVIGYEFLAGFLLLIIFISAIRFK